MTARIVARLCLSCHLWFVVRPPLSGDFSWLPVPVVSLSFWLLIRVCVCVCCLCQMCNKLVFWFSALPAKLAPSLYSPLSLTLSSWEFFILAKSFIVCRVFKLHFLFIDRATNFAPFQRGRRERETVWRHKASLIKDPRCSKHLRLRLRLRLVSPRWAMPNLRHFSNGLRMRQLLTGVSMLGSHTLLVRIIELT